MELEKQREAFDKKVMEVIAIKKSHQNQEAELRYEIDRLKGQLQRTKEDLAKAAEKSKKVCWNLTRAEHHFFTPLISSHPFFGIFLSPFVKYS